MIIKIIMALLFVLMISGCAGTGFNKKATLMPDEISMAVDADPQNDWNLSEITGGLKWKLE